MPFDFRFPDVGEGIAEGEIVAWLVKAGDAVREHQPVAKIETDKAIVELPSPKAGIIAKIHHQAGDTVKVGEILVTIEETAEGSKPQPAKSVSVVGELPEQEVVIERKKVQKAKPAATVAAAPATRRLAKELSIDLSKIKGTGLQGRVTEEDVRKHAPVVEEKPAPLVVRKYDLYGYIEHVPLRGVRKATARRMARSAYTAPHVTHMDSADVTQLAKIRHMEKLKAAEKGIRLTFLPFIIKAIVAALQKHPYVNASLDDEHEEIVLKKYYNIGVAVDTEDGLIVPVVKGAEQKTVLELARELQALARKAQERTLDLADLRGGTFTITNVGAIGGIHATPIINHPEVAILATGRIRSELRMVQGQVVQRRIVPLSLAFDHRVIDGAEAARFMNHVILVLQNPDLLLAEE